MIILIRASKYGLLHYLFIMVISPNMVGGLRMVFLRMVGGLRMVFLRIIVMHPRSVMHSMSTS
jgi:hypothetical protein